MTKLDDLPDDIHIDILSRLPTVDSVRYSLVSRRFQHLWKQVPDLSFEFTSDVQEMGQLYQNFVDFVLQSRTSLVVRTFSLYCHDNIEFQSISNWIDYSVNHSVEELKLQLEIENLADQVEPLPVSLFSCPTLLKFDLCNYGRIIIPADSEGLSSLKIWTLQYSEFVDGPRTTSFFQHCPSLEKLKFEWCCWSCELVQISCPLLRSVIIHYGSEEERDCEVVIMAPRLEYFEYEGEAEVEYSLAGCTNLLEAKIDVHCPEDVLLPVPLADRTTNMVEGLKFVRTLSISTDTLQILSFYHFSLLDMPHFGNLTTLTITENAVAIGPISGLLKFLNLCDSVVQLEAMEGMFYSPGSPDVDNVPLPICLRSTLGAISIRNFEGTRVQVQAVCYWLKFSTAIVYVHFEGRKEESERFTHQYGVRLQSFSRRLHIRQ